MISSLQMQLMSNRSSMIIFAVFFFGAMSGLLHAETGKYVWHIQHISGSWDYQEGGKPPQKIPDPEDKEPYFPITSEGQIRCNEVQVNACKLYYHPEGQRPEVPGIPLALDGLLQPKKFVKLDTLNAPEGLTRARIDAAQDKEANRNHLGGKGVSGCTGDFPLIVPVCGETIDPAEFFIQWAVEPNATGTVKVMVRLAGQERMFRGDPKANAGRYSEERLGNYLRSLQKKESDVDVELSLDEQNGARRATRVVHIPSTSRMARLQQQRETASQDQFNPTLSLMDIALKEGMWSRAGELAKKLLQEVLETELVKEYALLGMCGSGLEQETSALRSELPKDIAEKRCPASLSNFSPVDSDRTLQASTPISGGTGQIPAGVALVIGNSKYRELEPLNSVKLDIDEMKKSLEARGFEVIKREDLTDMQAFEEAIGDLKKLKSIDRIETLIVYYSGHGVEIDGRAQLLGTGAPANLGAQNLRQYAMDVDKFVVEIEGLKPTIRIVIIDACRDEPYPAIGEGKQATRQRNNYVSPDVPNTVVMFANGPGLPTPDRLADTLASPFTDALVSTLDYSTGDIREIFELAKDRTKAANPKQLPEMQTSPLDRPITLKPAEAGKIANRMDSLWSEADRYYGERSWGDFRNVIDRARALATKDSLKLRLDNERSFVDYAIQAKKMDDDPVQNKEKAAQLWNQAYQLFPARHWVALNAAIDYLLSDKLPQAVSLLGPISATNAPEAKIAKSILDPLVQTFPEYSTGATKSSTSNASSMAPGFASWLVEP